MVLCTRRVDELGFSRLHFFVARRNRSFARWCIHFDDDSDFDPVVLVFLIVIAGNEVRADVRWPRSQEGFTIKLVSMSLKTSLLIG